MYERGTGRIKFVVVDNDRSAASIIPIIRQNIPPTCQIFSDLWAAYNGLTALLYVHEVVNHSENFVQPASRIRHAQNGSPLVHTNAIEATWCAAKLHFR